MTARDYVPFGKFKGIKTWEQLKSDNKDYVAWLRETDWFATKFPAEYEYLTSGKEASTPRERANLEIGDQLLKGMSREFQMWWQRAYGEKLRRQGELIYIPILRVAIEAWKARGNTEETAAATIAEESQHEPDPEPSEPDDEDSSSPDEF